MVATRSSTGTIVKKHYDLKTLRLRGEKAITKVKNPKAHSKQSFRDVRRWTDLPEGFKEHFKQLSVPTTAADHSNDYQSFALPFCIGKPEIVAKSVLERADEKIEQLKLLKEVHEKHMPRAVPVIQVNLLKAIEDRQKLANTEENRRTINVAMRDEVVKGRIKTLTEALKTSTFGPEQDNIKCAIAGYRTGTIPYQEAYTLIWAGKIVETAKDYESIAVDRDLRLDRYLKDHGPGWLWYERGLKIHPAAVPRAARCTELSRVVSPHGLGQYYITQGFQKRAGWVMRMPQATPIPPLPLPQDITNQWAQTDAGLLWCQQEGPRLAINSLLDSGATFPTVYPGDIVQLGIDRDRYAAQTIERVLTANGFIESRSYEMCVTVLNHDNEDLVDANDAVWPNNSKYLGGLCPVLICQGHENGDVNAEGFAGAARLSGILPFLACYYTSVPTRNKIYFGEDRNDVVGVMRFPGQRRWEMGMSSEDVAAGQNWQMYGVPEIQFTHRDGQVVDRDRTDVNHASYVVVNEGLPNELRIDNYPAAGSLVADAAAALQFNDPDNRMW